VSLVTICRECRRFQGLKPDTGFVCEAYPSGVPVEIWATVVDHHNPYTGDHGLQFLAKEDAADMTIATDPPVSEQQRKLMFAAAAGHVPDVPVSVGKEFVEADPGGKLPARAKDMSDEDWGFVRRGFQALMKFFGEERQEPEHQGQDEIDVEKGPKKAASIGFVTADGQMLFLKRSKDEQNFPETWCLPGGRMDAADESIEQCAQREAREECGVDCSFDGMRMFDFATTPRRWEHTTYLVPVKEPFEPKLSAEHSEAAWRPITDLPEPMHPGLKASIDRFLAGANDEAFKDLERSLAAKDTLETGPIGTRQTVKGQHEATHNWEDRIEEGGNSPAKVREMSRVVNRNAPASYAGDEAALGPEWEMIVNALAFDRESMRQYDKDGRLHVEKSPISKAQIAGYLGKEINGVMAGEPGWVDLEPERKYQMFRSPEELEKAASTFNGLPILSQHIPISADAHKSEFVIGATGNDAAYEHPYLVNSLTFWPRAAIEQIENGTKRELSPGYSYKALMEPGEYLGEPFDGRMVSLAGNHLAQVVEGRSGIDVAVMDSSILGLEAQWAIIEESISAAA
jgi:8-oxo-dGTP pyrophosphatase MutT (NUDIX family)